MTQIIKPVQTTYNGHRFRSRTEARWAVFYDVLGIAWEYEKDGYNLGDAGWYLPDFWLPQQQCWVEIKGEMPNDLVLRKVSALAEATQRAVHISWGRVARDPFWEHCGGGPGDAWGTKSTLPVGSSAELTIGVFSLFSHWVECADCGTLWIDLIVCPDEYIATSPAHDPRCVCRKVKRLQPRIDSAYAVARQERF